MKQPKWQRARCVRLAVSDANLAHRMFNVLVTHCGASETHRVSFVRYVTKGDVFGRWEYRFQGALGFGGKCHVNDRTACVTCYSEDETPERRIMIDSANKELAQLCLTSWDTMEPDPLTVLLDAIWIEAQWRRQLDMVNRAYRSVGVQPAVEPDSISGRNVFWVMMMEQQP
jgi:hypothetical protein